MAPRRRNRKAPARGSIDVLPSGALRVRVYAGLDPVTHRRHDLTEIISPGPDAERQARDLRDRLVSEVKERRNPRTNASVDQLLERYFDQFDGAPSTLDMYRGYVRNHISPFLGGIKVGAVDADTLDSFYAELRRCRTHCSGKRFTEHRTAGPHECDDRCGPHRCRPLGAWTIRHMHFILSGAYKRAVRWRWVALSPVPDAAPPAAPRPNPEPPTPEQAARIMNEAWRDPDWGAFVWVAMTTGARRGELCALRWSAVDLNEGRETIWLRQAIHRTERGPDLGALKTHQQRRLALDRETAEVLREHRTRAIERAETLGVKLSPEAFVFSASPDGSTFPKPNGATQRYDRLVARLGIDTTLHKLRHYSATDLIAAGVDVRTVAGRLGHAGGGYTTLRTYTAWVSEADQRAATGIGTRMPSRPGPAGAGQQFEPRHAYERIAADLHRRIASGELEAGDTLPTEEQLAANFNVALGTAHRAMELLHRWGLVSSARGRRSKVSVARPEPEVSATDATEHWLVTLRGPDGKRYPPRVVRADLNDPDSFRAHLIGIGRVEVPDLCRDGDAWIGNCELEVRKPGSATQDPLLTLRWAGT